MNPPQVPPIGEHSSSRFDVWNAIDSPVQLVHAGVEVIPLTVQLFIDGKTALEVNVQYSLLVPHEPATGDGVPLHGGVQFTVPLQAVTVLWNTSTTFFKLAG